MLSDLIAKYTSVFTRLDDYVNNPGRYNISEKIDIVADIRDNLTNWSSNKEIKRIWNQPEKYLQDNSLLFLSTTVDHLVIKNQVHTDLGRSTDDLIYLARDMAITRYENEIIPRYVAIFGPECIRRNSFRRKVA